MGAETGVDVGVEVEKVEVCISDDWDGVVFGKWTTPIAGKISAKQLEAQIRIKPVNFMVF